MEIILRLKPAKCLKNDEIVERIYATGNNVFPFNSSSVSCEFGIRSSTKKFQISYSYPKNEPEPASLMDEKETKPEILPFTEVEFHLALFKNLAWLTGNWEI